MLFGFGNEELVMDIHVALAVEVGDYDDAGPSGAL